MKITAPFQRSSKTSREAAESVEHLVETQLEKVYSLISEKPRTDQEVAKVLGMQISSITARRRALVLEGRVRDSQLRRKNSSGRNAVIWEAGEAAEPSRPSRSELESRIEKAIMHIETAGYQEVGNFRANLQNILKGI